MGKIICIIGKSGTGKTTLFEKYKELFNKSRFGSYHTLIPITEYTTRQRRLGESISAYNFSTLEEMQEMLNNNEIIEVREYNTVNGKWYYFNSSKNIDLEHNNYLCVITYEALLSFKEKFGDDNVVCIYLEAEDEYERFNNLLLRESKLKSNYKELARRCLSDEDDFAECDDLNNKHINYRLKNPYKDFQIMYEQFMEIVTEILGY